MLVMLLGQSRVFYSMAHDGLLPKKCWRHPSQVSHAVEVHGAGGIVVACIVGPLVPIGDLGQMVSIGTLMAFVIVCAGVWVMRVKRPEVHRPFKTPWVPFVPIMGIIHCVGDDAGTEWSDLDPAGGLADHWDGHLFHLRAPSQQGAEAAGANRK